jgi:hypothetical protein
MKQKFSPAACIALMLAMAPAHALDFDAAYTVAAPFSTVQVNEFALDGPTPWLFIDLPALGSLFTATSSSWFVAGTNTALTQSSRSEQELDRFWLAPSDLAWNTAKSTGLWHIDATFNLVGILFAENGGIGVGISEGAGSTAVNFSVSPAPVPLPGGGCLLSAALLAVSAGWRRRRCAESGVITGKFQ